MNIFYQNPHVIQRRQFFYELFLGKDFFLCFFIGHRTFSGLIFFSKWTKYFSYDLSFKLNNRVEKKITQSVNTMTFSGTDGFTILSFFVKFVYSEKATKFCEIFTLLLSTVHTDKKKDFAKFCGLLRIYELYYLQARRPT